LFFFVYYNYLTQFILKKELGIWHYVTASEALEPVGLAVLTRFESWKPEEVTVFAAQARNDAKNRDIHSFFDL
jgi:hypothetical protein